MALAETEWWCNVVKLVEDVKRPWRPMPLPAEPPFSSYP
jgi:hypothetical protein